MLVHALRLHTHLLLRRAVPSASAHDVRITHVLLLNYTIGTPLFGSLARIRHVVIHAITGKRVPT